MISRTWTFPTPGRCVIVPSDTDDSADASFRWTRILQWFLFGTAFGVLGTHVYYAESVVVG
jgi:hypothetical protein